MCSTNREANLKYSCKEDWQPKKECSASGTFWHDDHIETPEGQQFEISAVALLRCIDYVA